MSAAASSSSAPALSVLLLGASGYIGGAVLAQLVESPVSRTWTFTLVVRGAAAAADLRSRYASTGRTLNVVLASHAELDRLSELASQSDVVINAADADDLPLARALVNGLAKRAAASPAPARKPLLLHTSGTSVLSAPGEEDGNTPPKHTYSDADTSDFWSLPVSAPHHAIDLAVVEGQDKGINTMIIIPPTIIGIGKGLKQQSIQVPQLISAALLRKEPQAGLLGTGANHWCFVHVLDLAVAYELILRSALKLTPDGLEDPAAPTAGFGKDGVHFAAAGEFSHKQLADAIGATLHKLAPELVRTAQVTPWSAEDIDGSLYGKFVGPVFGRVHTLHTASACDVALLTPSSLDSLLFVLFCVLCLVSLCRRQCDRAPRAGARRRGSIAIDRWPRRQRMKPTSTAGPSVPSTRAAR